MGRYRYGTKDKDKNVYSLDFKYAGVDFDYDTEYGADGNGCDCGDDYCRCGRIVNAKATSVDTSTVAESILDHLQPQKNSDDKTIAIYCIDRILVAQEAFKTDMYTVEVGGGYYGEEINGVTLNSEADVDSHIKTVLALQTNAQKIEYVLDLEYNKILDAVKNKEWSVEKISIDDLSFGSKQQEKKARKSELEMYKEWSLPRGIAIADGGKYRLIDGYHRCSACGDKKIQLIIGR